MSTRDAAVQLPVPSAWVHRAKRGNAYPLPVRLSVCVFVFPKMQREIKSRTCGRFFCCSGLAIFLVIGSLQIIFSILILPLAWPLS